MHIVVRAYDVLGALAISVAQSDQEVAGESAVLHHDTTAYVVIPREIASGTFADQLAFLAECLLDVAHDRTT